MRTTLYFLICGLLWTVTGKSQGPTANELVKQGLDIYENTGDIYGALHQIDKALELDSTCVEAYVQRGRLRFDLEYFRQAVSDFDKAIALDPGSADAWYRRAYSEIRSGDFDRAFSDCDSAISIDPGFADAYMVRGLSQLMRGDTTAACSDLSVSGALGNTDAEEYAAAYCP